MADEKKTQSYEAGRYPVRPMKAHLTQSKAGVPQVCVVVRHLEGAYQGREDYWYGGLGTDDAAEKTVETLQDCGWTGNNLQAIAFPADAIASAVYQLDKDQDGNERVRLRYLNKNGFVPRAMDAQVLEVAAARAAAALERVNARRGAPAPVVSETLRPHLAQLQRAVSVDDAAALWLQVAPSLSSDDKVTLWTAIAARFDANAAKEAVTRMKAARSAAVRPAPTVSSMPLPEGF